MPKNKPSSYEIRKITEGFVTQHFDAHTGEFLGQEFTAGDDCEYTNEEGESLELKAMDEPAYQPYDMIGPDDELAAVIAAWPTMSDGIKAGIKALVGVAQNPDSYRDLEGD